MNEEQAIITYPQQTTEVAPWYTDFDTVMMIVVSFLFICGIITALVAKNNGRSFILGFLSGFFMGQFGIMTYMIMGEKE